MSDPQYQPVVPSDLRLTLPGETSPRVPGASLTPKQVELLRRLARS